MIELDHHCCWCDAPYAECPDRDDFGHCVEQPWENVNGARCYDHSHDDPDEPVLRVA
jgi:hypothetical protein